MVDPSVLDLAGWFSPRLRTEELKSDLVHGCCDMLGATSRPSCADFGSDRGGVTLYSRSPTLGLLVALFMIESYTCKCGFKFKCRSFEELDRPRVA